MVKETDTMIEAPILGELQYREWHAIIDGLYCGVNDIHDTEYTQEKHYWRTGWLVGDAYDKYLR
jgi:hypothetical protein